MSIRSTGDHSVRRSRRGKRLAVGLVVLAALIAVGAAYAYSAYRYSPTSQTQPGTSYQTGGWANRVYNYACREVGGYGWARARYYNSSGNVVADTNSQYTNCSDGAAARLDGNGYYRSWCRHDGTVAWQMACVTTQP